MNFYTRYKVPKSPTVAFEPGTSKTRQEFLQESDVNRLVERFRDTGSFYDPLTSARASKSRPIFADVTQLPDYQSCLDIVIDADQKFAGLPARVRERFANDPAQLLAFLHDSKNRAEAIELGLLPKPEKVDKFQQQDLPLEEPPEAAN